MKDTYDRPAAPSGFDTSLSDALAAKHGIELPRVQQARFGAGFGLLMEEDTASLLLRFGKMAQFGCILFAGIIPNILFMKFALGWF